MKNPDNVLPSDKNKVSSQLRFTFEKKSQKLVIEALNPDDDSIYFREISVNPMVDFDCIKQMLEQAEYKVLIKNQDLLKIKIGPLQLQMASKSQLQQKDYEQTIKKLLQQKSYLEEILNSQDEQIFNLKKRLQFLEKKTQDIPFMSILMNTKWSQELKGSNLQINGSSIYNNQQVNGEFGLLYQKCWAIKINKLTGDIYLGVCLKNIIQAECFIDQSLNLTKTGHGFYLIGSNNMCFSHSSKNYNDKQLKKLISNEQEQEQLNDEVLDLAFSEGDVIYCQYDPIKSFLTWMINNGPKKLKMPIVLPPKNDAYHPCVLFYNKSDSVELITQN